MVIYLLDVRTITQETWDVDPESLVDAGRKERTLGLPVGAKRNASVAASLLLQYGLGRYGQETAAGKAGSDDTVRIASAREVMTFVAKSGPAEYAYRYGQHGKPEFTDPNLPCFNISHSGDYVALVLSDRECGIDLQKMEVGRNVDSIAERFFSAEEAEAVRREGEETFFRLWTRKEALAKCTGEGIAPEIGRDLRDLNGLDDLHWTEWQGLPGYLLAACEKEKG